VDFARFRACYPESKRASETLTLSYARQYGLDTVIVRPAFIYGKDIIDSNTRADVYFLRQALNHQDIVMYSDGSQIRSYCYVKDCVSGMMYALLKGESGGIYNIGDENCAVTLREYALKLAAATGVKVVIDASTRPAGTVLLQTTRMVLDTTRLRALGWEPQYDLDAGVQDMLG
jgi:nucleoside-diphosphate-sugar epimerase